MWKCSRELYESKDARTLSSPISSKVPYGPSTPGERICKAGTSPSTDNSAKEKPEQTFSGLKSCVGQGRREEVTRRCNSIL